MTTLCLLRTVVIIIWVIAALDGLPLFIHSYTKEDDFGSYCLVNENNIDIRAYVTVNFIIWYIIPLILMCVMYSRISVVLWTTSKSDGLMRNTVSVGKPLQSCAVVKPTKKGRLVSFNKTVVRIEEKAGYEPVGRSNQVGNCTTSGSSDEASTPVKTTNGHNGSEDCNREEMENSRVSDMTGSEESLESYAKDYENDWPSKRRSPPDGIKLYITKPASDSDTPLDSTNHKPSRVAVPALNRMTRLVATQKVQGRRENALVARRKVIRLLIAVIVSFAVCVLPYYIRWLWMLWGYMPITEFSVLSIPITFLLLYFQSGLNPILYAFLSENFRKSLREVLSCRHRRGGQRNVRSTTTSVKTANSNL